MFVVIQGAGTNRLITIFLGQRAKLCIRRIVIRNRQEIETSFIETGRLITTCFQLLYQHIVSLNNCRVVIDNDVARITTTSIMVVTGGKFLSIAWDCRWRWAHHRDDLLEFW